MGKCLCKEKPNVALNNGSTQGASSTAQQNIIPHPITRTTVHDEVDGGFRDPVICHTGSPQSVTTVSNVVIVPDSHEFPEFTTSGLNYQAVDQLVLDTLKVIRTLVDKYVVYNQEQLPQYYIVQLQISQFKIFHLFIL